MNTEEKIDKLIENARKSLVALHEAVNPLSVFPDGEKYASVSLEVSGHTTPASCAEFKFFLGDGLHIRSDSAKNILKAIADYSPEAAKAQKIAKLEAELAALKVEVSK